MFSYCNGPYCGLVWLSTKLVVFSILQSVLLYSLGLRLTSTRWTMQRQRPQRALCGKGLTKSILFIIFFYIIKCLATFWSKLLFRLKLKWFFFFCTNCLNKFFNKVLMRVVSTGLHGSTVGASSASAPDGGSSDTLRQTDQNRPFPLLL